jgi:hypothetical protein
MILSKCRFDMSWGLAAVMLLAGCGPDKAEKAELVPVGSREFEYRVATDQFYPPGAEDGAESARLRWLAFDLEFAKLCPGDYDILSRQVIFQYQSTLGFPVDEIIYRGRCRV